MDNPNRILHAGEQLLIILKPTFYRDDSSEVEYGKIPSEVQKEVLNFLNSKYFINDQAENYALSEIAAMPQGSKYESYPVFDTKIHDIKFYIDGDILLVYLYCRLVNHQISSSNNSKNKIYTPITLSLYNDIVKEGFHKASNDGPLISMYGKYLGEGRNKYNIYLNPHRTNTYLQ